MAHTRLPRPLSTTVAQGAQGRSAGQTAGTGGWQSPINPLPPFLGLRTAAGSPASPARPPGLSSAVCQTCVWLRGCVVKAERVEGFARGCMTRRLHPLLTPSRAPRSLRLTASTVTRHSKGERTASLSGGRLAPLRDQALAMATQASAAAAEEAHIITTPTPPFVIVAVRAPATLHSTSIQALGHHRLRPAPHAQEPPPRREACVLTRTDGMHPPQVNQPWVNLCGYSSAEAIGRTCRIIQGPETSLPVLADLHAAVSQKRATTVRGVPRGGPGPGASVWGGGAPPRAFCAPRCACAGLRSQ